jgi:hypothetical protein
MSHAAGAAAADAGWAMLQERSVASPGSAYGAATTGPRLAFSDSAVTSTCDAIVAVAPRTQVVPDVHIDSGGQKWPATSQQSEPAGAQPPPHGTSYPSQSARATEPHWLGVAAQVPSSQQNGVAELQQPCSALEQHCSALRQQPPLSHVE